MNPLAYFYGDILQVIFSHFSHKALFDLVYTSRGTGIMAIEEGVRRYFGSRKEYEAAIAAGTIDTRDLAKKGAYIFLAYPGVELIRLEWAAESLDMDMVLLALRTGASDYHEGCVCAAENGDWDITMLLYAKIEHPSISEFLRAAYMGGNRNLIAFFIAQESPPNWDSAVEGACMSGRPDLVDEVFDKYTLPRERLILHACFSRGDDLAMVKYLVEKKGVAVVDGTSISAAIEIRSNIIADYLLDTFPAVDTTRIFLTACQYGSAKFAKRLMPGSEREIYEGVRGACMFARLNVIVLLSQEIKIDWNQALRWTAGYCHTMSPRILKTMWYCRVMGATNVEEAARQMVVYDPDKRLDLLIKGPAKDLIEYITERPLLEVFRDGKLL
jgi:hypothetical protein